MLFSEKIVQLRGMINIRDVFESIYEALDIVSKINHSIDFQYVPNFKQRNVLIVGNIGSGKSTSLNKIVHGIQDKKEVEVENRFVAKRSTKSVTLKTEQQLIDDINLIDS